MKPYSIRDQIIGAPQTTAKEVAAMQNEVTSSPKPLRAYDEAIANLNWNIEQLEGQLATLYAEHLAPFAYSMPPKATKDSEPTKESLPPIRTLECLAERINNLSAIVNHLNCTLVI